MRVLQTARIMRAQDQGTYFLGCVRCMGHGHFVIPNFGAQSEVFSRMEAWRQLGLFVTKGLVPMRCLASLTSQVLNSGLPELCPADVQDAVRTFFETEAWAARFSERGENAPQHVYITENEMVAVVHDYYLDRSPMLRLQ